MQMQDAHVRNKMASVYYNSRLITTSLVNKCKSLKEIDGGQTCISTSRKYGRY